MSTSHVTTTASGATGPNGTGVGPAPQWRSPLLARHGAVEALGADAGVAWHYGDPVHEQRLLFRGRGVVDLSHLGVVRVSGEERLNWLSSISSQQLEGLAVGVSTETLVLDPQGRVEHAAAVIDDGEATWLITETAAPLAQWLLRMRFMKQVEITDETESYATLGEAVEPSAAAPAGAVLTWQDPWPTTAAGGTRYGPPDTEHPGLDRPWRLVLVPRGELEAIVLAREAAGQRLAGTWASEALRVAAWRPRFSTEVDHRAIPHEVDWLRTAVHLHKGCYRGQESIARVHNLGRPPRRLVLLHLDGSQDLLPEHGAIVRLAGKAVGTVTSAVRHHEDGPLALALVRRATPLDAELDVEIGIAVTPDNAEVTTNDAGATPGAAAGDAAAPAPAPELPTIAAAQEEIVSGEGVSPDRPAARGQLTRGLRPPV